MDSKCLLNLRELKKVSIIAAPMVVITVLLYLLQVVSVTMVGHLDEVSLSAVSIASSFTSVTGFSLLFGMAGALETLCGQAYGARQYERLGIYTYCSIISLILVCFPISLLWTFTDRVLIIVGQDTSVALLARKYAVFLIPNLFSYAILQSLIRYFQTQSLIHPMIFSSLATLCFHLPLCWVLVFTLKLRIVGAALAISLSYWLNVVFLGLYMKYSSACEKSRATFSTSEVFWGIRKFFCIAIPSAIMTCLEWWSYEILLLLSGILPNPKLETSVLSICFTVTYLHYFIPYGFGATVSTRVSNELGAGNPRAAKMAVLAVMVLAIADGVARGSGWQHIGAYVNLGAYYLVGTPLASVLAFVLHLKARGLLIGLTAGSFVQATLLGLITVSTNWEKQASKAREAIYEDTREDHGETN